MSRRPSLEGVNDSRLDVRLPHELKADVEELAAELGVTAPTLTRIVLALLTGRGQGLEVLLRQAKAPNL